MQALVLVGGAGTRLRPLTARTPKPALTLVDRPFLVLLFEWLARHGVEDVILSCGFLPDRLREVIDPLNLPVGLRYVVEPEPLGTGGALKFAEEYLDDRFFMLNGDSLTDLDLTAQLKQHEATGARGTLMLVRVDDPSSFGLVRLDDSLRVSEFLEKPSPEEAAGVDTVSAGAYVLEKSVLDLLEPGRPASIERDVFPRLVNAGLYGHTGSGYWLDVGTPKRYLTGTFDLLDGSVASGLDERLGPERRFLAPGVTGDVVAPALIEAGCELGAGSRVGPYAVLQAGVSVGAASAIERSVVFEGARIGAGCKLRDCVIGRGVTLADGVTVTGESLIGDGARIGAGNVIEGGARIDPDSKLPDASG